MEYFAIFIEVPDFEKIKSDLMYFKHTLKKDANVTVISLEESNYDFLYNSLVEKANQEQKRRD